MSNTSMSGPLKSPVAMFTALKNKKNKKNKKQTTTTTGFMLNNNCAL